MAALAEILEALDRLLEPGEFPDACPNGLQVEGRADVERVVTGVSASVELFERALELRADLIVVHHGLFWNGDDPRIVGALRARLAPLLKAEVSLAAYHLPLDGHPTIGNNALIVSGLGGTIDAPFARSARGTSAGSRPSRRASVSPSWRAGSRS